MTNGYGASNKSVLLDVKGLKKYFPIRRGLLQKTVGLVKAVDDVTFFVNRGETLSLVGESGCGKTTTARCILRAITPTAGQVLLSDNGVLLDVATVPKSKLIRSSVGPNGLSRKSPTARPTTAPAAELPAAHSRTCAGSENAPRRFIACGPAPA